jgi:hypothetical protein
MNHLARTALAAGAAVTLMAGVSSLSASAAPLAANAELKAAVTSNTIDVQRRWRRRAAIGVGALGLGIVAGAAIANSNRGYYYYDEPYGYYEQPYGYYYYQQPYGSSYYSGPYGNPYDGNY